MRLLVYGSNSLRKIFLWATDVKCFPCFLHGYHEMTASWPASGPYLASLVLLTLRAHVSHLGGGEYTVHGQMAVWLVTVRDYSEWFSGKRLCVHTTKYGYLDGDKGIFQTGLKIKRVRMDRTRKEICTLNNNSAECKLSKKIELSFQLGINQSLSLI